MNTTPWYIAGWIVILFLIVFVRYLAFSGLYEWLLVRGLGRGPWRHRRIAPLAPQQELRRREIARSAVVSLIFAATGIGLLWMYEAGLTRLYLDPSEYSLIWLVLGPVLFLLLQETYYYWVHRWMHLPRIYPLVHKAHHESIDTTVWTAFSFHPLEGLLQAVFLPLIVLVLPLHVYAFLGLLSLMTLSATINHAGIEVFPRGFARHWLGRWLIGATHHDQHHKAARFNFGLYFTFWDKWMQTESPKYERDFARHTEGRTPPGA